MSHPTTVRLDDAEYRELKRLADERGVTVSELVRRAVRSHYLEEDREKSVRDLMDYISEHRHTVEEDADAIDSEIQRALRDAAD